MTGGRLLLFGDFMDLGADDKKYVEITDAAEVRTDNGMFYHGKSSLGSCAFARFGKIVLL